MQQKAVPKLIKYETENLQKLPKFVYVYSPRLPPLLWLPADMLKAVKALKGPVKARIKALLLKQDEQVK